MEKPDSDKTRDELLQEIKDLRVELARKQADARIFLEKYRVLFHSFPQGITLSDEAGNIIEVNEASERILGIPTSNQTRKKVDSPDWQIMRPDGSPFPPEEFPGSRALREKRVVESEEMGIYREPGKITWLDVSAAPIQLEGYGVAVAYSDITERKRTEENLVQANQIKEKLQEMVMVDPLTGLYNRRWLDESIQRETRRAARKQKDVSVVIGDIDHFKKVNDVYGHPAGDEVLKSMAALFTANLRVSDIACRYGGEEFLMVFPETELAFALKRVEQIRQLTADTIFLYEGSEIRISISFGVSVYPYHGQTPEEVVNKADKALYVSKNRGRNCVTAWDESLVAEE